MPRYALEINFFDRLKVTEQTMTELKAALVSGGIKPETTRFRVISEEQPFYTESGEVVYQPYRLAMRFTYYAGNRHAIEPIIPVLYRHLATS